MSRSKIRSSILFRARKTLPCRQNHFSRLVLPGCRPWRTRRLQDLPGPAADLVLGTPQPLMRALSEPSFSEYVPKSATETSSCQRLCSSAAYRMWPVWVFTRRPRTWRPTGHTAAGKFGLIAAVSVRSVKAPAISLHVGAMLGENNLSRLHVYRHELALESGAGDGVQCLPGCSQTRESLIMANKRPTAGRAEREVSRSRSPAAWWLPWRNGGLIIRLSRPMDRTRVNDLCAAVPLTILKGGGYGRV